VTDRFSMTSVFNLVAVRPSVRPSVRPAQTRTTFHYRRCADDDGEFGRHFRPAFTLTVTLFGIGTIYRHYINNCVDKVRAYRYN